MNDYGQVHIYALWIPSSYLCPGQAPINQGHLNEDQKNLCVTAKGPDLHGLIQLNFEKLISACTPFS